MQSLHNYKKYHLEDFMEVKHPVETLQTVKKKTKNHLKTSYTVTFN